MGKSCDIPREVIEVEKTASTEKNRKIHEKVLKLIEYLRERGDAANCFEYGVSYFITLKDSRNNELCEFLSRYIDLDLFKNKKVLDVGCGTGNFLAYLQDNGVDAFGIDADKKIVNIAFTSNILVGDAQKLPFKDETFDMIVAFDVFEHLQNQKAAVQNMLAKTKPGGKVVLLTNNRLFPFDTDKKLFFINYLPRKLATKYLRFRRKNHTLEYDNQNPTYFSFLRLCAQKPENKIHVNGIFTIYGYYVEKYGKLKRLGAVMESLSNRCRFLRWMQWFAPKLSLYIEKP